MKEIKWRKIISRGKHPILVTDTAAIALTKYTKPVQGCPNYRSYKRIAGESLLDETEWKRIKDFYRKKIRKSPLKLFESIEDCNMRDRELIRLAKEISKTDLKRLSYLELRKIFVKFIDLYNQAWSYIYTPWTFEEILVERIEKELGKKIKDVKQIEKYLVILTTPSKHVRDFKLKLELLKLACRIKKNKKLNLDKILSLKKRYEWWGTYLFNVKTYKLNNIISDLKQLVKKDPQRALKEFMGHEKKQRNKFRNAQARLRKLNFSSLFFDYVKTIREVAFWRAHRIEDLAIVHFYLKPLLFEIAKRRDLKYQDIIQLTVDEVVKNKGTIREIKERRKDYGYLLIKGKTKIYTGSSLRKLKEKELKRIKQVKELKGVSANPGRIKGIIQILKGVYQYKKIKPGKILVIPMTTPEITQYLKKTKAIVTNEGGGCSAMLL